MSKSKSYAVRFRGIDGSSTKRFSSLKAAAAYVKSRYLGDDYVRSADGLQAEFGYYTFSGFTWADLGKWVAGEDCQEFKWYEEFGGDLDRLLDPTAPGDYSICEVHPHFHQSYDYCTGASFKTVCRAATAGEARAKLKRIYDKAGDSLEGMDFNPYAVFFKGREIHLRWCDGDAARQAAEDLEMDRRLKTPATAPAATAEVANEEVPF